MLTDWIYWLSSVPRHELWLLLSMTLIFDAPRYLFGSLLLWVVDFPPACWQALIGEEVAAFDFCPSVCVVVAGLNEAASLEQSLTYLWGSYPKLEIIVVDDGSDDGMTDVANEFARVHANVLVITKRERGGKSAAMNAAIPITTAEVVVILDADSELAHDALWEVVQPLRDPRVAAVSGNVLVRNRSANLLTRIQALEYLRSILLGRLVSSRLGLLGIVSGAFGAFRRSALERIGGWDVGPGEDEDIVLRLRKLGYLVEFAPYAECYTDVPTSLRTLTRQRRRWEWAVVSFQSRKHIDLANPLSANFRVSNFALVVERWVFNLFLPLWFWVYFGWLLIMPHDLPLLKIGAIFYVVYCVMELMQLLVLLFYSRHPWRDAQLAWVPFVMPLYQALQRCVTTVAIVEEMLTRRSYRDTFVPGHVRRVAWRW